MLESLFWMLQILPLCSDPEPNAGRVWALPLAGLGWPSQKPVCPCQPPRLPRLFASAHHVAPWTPPSGRICPLRQPTASVGPAEEQLWHLHPPGPAGDLPNRARLRRGLRPGLIRPLHPHHLPPLAQTQALNLSFHQLWNLPAAWNWNRLTVCF